MKHQRQCSCAVGLAASWVDCAAASAAHGLRPGSTEGATHHADVCCCLFKQTAVLQDAGDAVPCVGGKSISMSINYSGCVQVMGVSSRAAKRDEPSVGGPMMAKQASSRGPLQRFRAVGPSSGQPMPGALRANQFTTHKPLRSVHASNMWC
jgi:hypothetical protein